MWAPLPPGPIRRPRAPLPRHRTGERLLRPDRRVLRDRRPRLRQADDDDRARRLPDHRPSDISALRPGRPGRAPAEAGAAHVRRRPGELVDRRRRHPPRARLQRRDVRRRRPRRGRRPGVPDLARARGPSRRAVAGSSSFTRATAIDRSSTAPARTTTAPTTPTSSRTRTSTNGRQRVRADIDWGQDTLEDHIRAYRPFGFSPPYGNYGQDGTNDPRIPEDLLGWLTQRYGAVFTQDRNARAHRGSGQPLGRIQVTRETTGGELHSKLLSGGP